MSIMANRIDQEHVLINSRMTWLMTLNGFLFAIYGVAVTNSDKFASGRAFVVVVIGSSAMGAICNASALYSHYWASRALKETEEAARWALANVHIAEDVIRNPTYLFRLFGRDPGISRTEGPKLSRPMHPFWPLHRLIHPWFFLPIICCFAFMLLPFAELDISIKGANYRLWSGVAALPLLAVFLIVVFFLHERFLEAKAARATITVRLKS
ncbi:hypothetical protein ACWKSP_41725 [Micromonosporaceae bacterium Da 78-11]